MSGSKATGRPAIPAWQSLVAQPAGVEDLGDAKVIDITLLEPNPYQPRRAFDEAALGELAASIRADGVLQPLAVRPHPTQARRYQIVAGERRWRAARLAGLAQVPCIERTMDDDALERLALVENVQRTDLDPIDEAHAYTRLMARLGLSQRDLAETIHKDQSYIALRLRLIEDPRIEAAVRAGTMSPTVGQETARIEDPAQRTDVIERAERGERVRVRDVKAVRAPGPSGPPQERPSVAAAGDLPPSPPSPPAAPVMNNSSDAAETAQGLRSPSPAAAPVMNNSSGVPEAALGSRDPRATGGGGAPLDPALSRALENLDATALDVVFDYGISLAWSCQELARVIRERRGLTAPSPAPRGDA